MVKASKVRVIKTAKWGEQEMQKYLDALQNEIPEFHAYYESHRPELDKIFDRIEWIIDPDRTPRSGCIPDYRILINSIPTTYDDAQIVSHEMEHCRLWEIGYPKIHPGWTGTKSDTIMVGICSAISNMIYNPIIELHLKKYYVDLCITDKKKFESQIKRLNEKTINNKNIFLIFCCYYVTGFLTIKWLCEEGRDFEADGYFQKGNGEKIAPCAKRIISIFEENGLISCQSIEEIPPDSIKKIIKEIADNFHLNFRYYPPENIIFLSYSD